MGYGTSIDAVRAIRFNGKVCLMSPMNLTQAVTRLFTASIQAFIVFITVPDELEPDYSMPGEEEPDNAQFSPERVADHQRMLATSRDLYRKFSAQVDRVIVKHDFEQCFQELEALSLSLMNDQQWVPARWIGQ